MAEIPTKLMTSSHITEPVSYSSDADSDARQKLQKVTARRFGIVEYNSFRVLCSAQGRGTHDYIWRDGDDDSWCWPCFSSEFAWIEDYLQQLRSTCSIVDMDECIAVLDFRIP